MVIDMLYGWLIFASFLWGSNVLVMRYMLEHTSSLFLADLKVLLSLIAVYLIMRYKKIALNNYPFKIGIVVSLFSITLNFILTFAGINLISGSSNAIINSLAPLVTVLLAWLFYHQHISKNQIIAVIIACVAFFMSINFDLSKLSLGHLLMIGGIIFYSIGNLIMQHHLQKDDNLPFTFQYLLYAFIELTILNIFIDNNSQLNMIPLSLWLLFILFSGIGFAIIQIIYFQAVLKIGSIKTSFLLGLNPVFTYIGSLLLQESFDLNRFLAMVLMVIAMFVANKKDSQIVN